MKTISPHPGEILKADYLVPLGITQYRLAKDLRMKQHHVSDIIRGHCGITANVAIRLGLYFGTTPAFWLNMQNLHDLDKADAEFGDVYKEIGPFVP